MKKITITEGYYRQKFLKRKFKVNIYRGEDGKLCMLYPTWVHETPEQWIRIE